MKADFVDTEGETIRKYLAKIIMRFYTGCVESGRPHSDILLHLHIPVGKRSDLLKYAGFSVYIALRCKTTKIP